MNKSVASIDELRDYATKYKPERDLPARFDDRPYTRIPIYRDSSIEIVVVCFAEGQTSSVHSHQGSNCVVRLMRGKILENLFTNSDDGTLSFESNHCLKPGDVSALDGTRVHQLINLDKRGSVLLNFYSPPFQM